MATSMSCLRLRFTLLLSLWPAQRLFAFGDGSTVEEMHPEETLSLEYTREQQRESMQHLALLLKGVETNYERLRESMGNSTFENASDTLRDGLDSIITNIEETVEGHIKLTKSGADKQINEALEHLHKRASNLPDAKDAADAADNEVLTCREQEKEILSQTGDTMTKLGILQATKTRYCSERDAQRHFNWKLFYMNVTSPLYGRCDFKESSTCAFEDLHTAFARIENLINAKKAQYSDVEEKCVKATTELDAFLAEGDHMDVVQSSTFVVKRDDCDAKAASAGIAMCGFGDRLQQKCASADRFRQIHTEVSQTDEDIRKMWSFSQELKCILRLFRQPALAIAGDIPAALVELTSEAASSQVPEECRLGIDFARDVGDVDYTTTEFDALMCGKYFTCAETRMGFSGRKWVMGYGPSDYMQVRWEPSVTISPQGSAPFEFCKAEHLDTGAP
jgi:hypothetical protein